MNSFYRATEKQSEDIVLPGSQVKRVLITGANSYIGTSIESYLLQWPDQYHIDTIDMIDESWRQKSFAGYDSVYHVAGIVHRDTSAIGGVNRRHYYAVNKVFGSLMYEQEGERIEGEVPFEESIVLTERDTTT